MAYFLWILAALLFCLGLGLLCRLLARRLHTPVQSAPGAGLWTVVAASGGPAQLEQTVGSLLWLQRSGTLCCDILVVDAGLDAEGRQAAALLARDAPQIHLWAGPICFTEDAWRKIDT